MAKTVDDIRNEVIDTIGEKAGKFGFSPIVGRIEGLLYLSGEPLSLDEMAERLEVSKASISTNVRVLERWKVVKRAYNKGTRRNLYQLRGRIWEIETELARTVAREEIERFKLLLHRTMGDLRAVRARSGAEKEQVALMRERLKELEEYVEAGEHLLELLLKKGEITPAVVKRISIS